MSMRVFDSEKMFSDALTMASGFSVGTVTSAGVIDMGVADADETSDPQVAIVIENPTSAAGNTGVLTLVLQDSPDGSGSWLTILTGKVSANNAADFNPYRMAIPPKHRRYLRTQYVVATQAFSAGTLHCGIV